jgi:hypothetical protein
MRQIQAGMSEHSYVVRNFGFYWSLQGFRHNPVVSTEGIQHFLFGAPSNSKTMTGAPRENAKLNFYYPYNINK